jgi:hypothetical protein
MDEATKEKDRWDKLDVIAKLIGGISIPLIGVLVSIALQRQAEGNRKAQLYIQVMSEREKADSSIRAEMFKSLLDRYSTSAKDERAKEEYFQNRITFLALLLNNFQEYFDAKPILESLYQELKESEPTFPDAAKWNALRDALFKTARRVASSQAVLLGRLGAVRDITMVEGETARIPLYDTNGLKGLDGFITSGSEGDEPGQKSETAETHRYSIALTVTGVGEESADVSVSLYDDRFNGVSYADSKFRGAFPVNVSYFDTPYMSNTRLFDSGRRFAMVYKGRQSFDEKNRISLSIVTFSEKFLSSRDRPYFEDMMEKIRGSR